MSSKNITAVGDGSARAARLEGMRQALGIPALILGFTYLGFGSLVRESGLSVWHGLFSTTTAWAIPGQIALVELYAVGASLLVIAFVVALTNARLLPMTVVLMPLLRDPGVPRWRYYFFANYVAITGWTAALRVCPTLPSEQRMPFYEGFSVTLWSVTFCATGLGFFLAGGLPPYVTMGLVFLNPIYFMLVFAADMRSRSRVMALLFGALIGPPLFLVTPEWSLLLTGLIAGSLAMAADRLLPRHEPTAS